jgi:hypothetical protein
MLQELQDALKVLPDLLSNREAWDSLIVNRRKPYTYRVFSKLPNGLRVCLHKFDTCHDHEAFAHPHPWSGAFLLLEGKYKMTVGRSNDRVSPPPPPNDVMTLILTPGSMYEITNPLTWHSVIPLETTYTIMVNGEPWEPDFAHKDVRTTKGKDLDKMPEDELIAHLAHFQKLLKEYK